MLTYNFPAVKGIQASSEYFICMIPLGLLKKIFSNDMGDVPPEYRAQRKLNEARIPEMRDYIINNRESYVFSALAASVDGDMKFVALNDSNIGSLEIDMNASFLINDGQHRKAAIVAAIEEDETLANETIPVVIFKDKGLQRSQQMFTDLNKHAVITSKSLNTLYESKDDIAMLSKELVNTIPFFRKYTDKEKDNLGKFSSNLFTLNNINMANKKMLAGVKTVDSSVTDFAKEFWSLVVLNMKEWSELEHGELSKKTLRENYIITQGVTLLALGRLGKYYYDNPHIDMQNSLQGLWNIDWSRSNANSWQGRAIKPNGSISRSESSILLTYIEIKRLLGLPISDDELQKEKF